MEILPASITGDSGRVFGWKRSRQEQGEDRDLFPFAVASLLAVILIILLVGSDSLHAFLDVLLDSGEERTFGANMALLLAKVAFLGCSATSCSSVALGAGVTLSLLLLGVLLADAVLDIVWKLLTLVLETSRSLALEALVRRSTLLLEDAEENLELSHLLVLGLRLHFTCGDLDVRRVFLDCELGRKGSLCPALASDNTLCISHGGSRGCGPSSGAVVEVEPDALVLLEFFEPLVDVVLLLEFLKVVVVVLLSIINRLLGLGCDETFDVRQCVAAALVVAGSEALQKVAVVLRAGLLAGAEDVVLSAW